MRALAETIDLSTLPEGEAVDWAARIVEDDPRRGDNVLEVETGSLAEGWYELRAGPLARDMTWAPGYELTDDGVASVHFRIGSEPSVANITV